MKKSGIEEVVFWNNPEDGRKERLTVLPSTGAIWCEDKIGVRKDSFVKEGLDKRIPRSREHIGGMLCEYYWNVQFKKEQVNPLPPSGLKNLDNYLYKVCFTVSDKKTLNDGRVQLRKVKFSPDAGLTSTAQTESGASDSDGNSTTSRSTAGAVDPDPTGTWTSGDRNSVFSRLVVRSSGTFSFETVDFTGDVKGGYSGTWRMNGNSIRFEWGRGGADSGSCSGRKTAQNRLVFGSTTFSR